MPDTTILIVVVFAVAGMVKGVIGLGLPAIAMGLLATVMRPVEAAALLVVPSLVTNIWQTAAGPALERIVRRLWPMLTGVAAGTLAAAGLMTGTNQWIASVALGIALVAYAITGLASIRFAVAEAAEWWLGPIVGLATGVIAAATGVFAIPAVPYLQGIGLEKEELVQALGLSFVVSTSSLAVAIARSAPEISLMSMMGVVALAAALGGMALGQALRVRLPQALFRTWFFVALALLGTYISVRAIFAVPFS